MPLIRLQKDQAGEALNFVNDTADEIAEFLGDSLTRVMDRVSPINSIFFNDPRVSVNGALLLMKLGAHVQFLATHYPEKMNATLARAGLYLNAHADGTVTYDPPPVITSSLQGVAVEINSPFSYQIVATNSPTSYALSGNPDGVNIDTSTGLITGSPIDSGIFNMTISASNSFGTSEKHFNLVVTDIVLEVPPE